MLTHAEYLTTVQFAQIAAADYYGQGDSLLSDQEFDYLLDRIRQYESEHPQNTVDHVLFTAVGSSVAPGTEVPHSAPMLSLDKVTTLADVHNFVQSVEGRGGTVVWEPKLDGIAVAVRYANGKVSQIITRGDGLSGEDITDRVLALTVSALPAQIAAGHIEVRGELVMSDEDFARTNASRVAAGKEAFKNPRNGAAGAVRAQTVTHDSWVTFIAHDVPADLADEGFRSARDVTPTSPRTTLIDAINVFGEFRKTAAYPYPTDGVVIKVVEEHIRKTLGSTSRAPRWAKAYKFEADTGVTVLRDIEMAVGRTGNISFTAALDPVFIDGSTVSRATLHHFDFITENDLRIGDTVEVYKANDIIPRVVKPLLAYRPHDAVPYDPERVCPVSGEPLDTSTTIWRSLAPEASLASWITYASSRDVLDIDGLGREIAVALVDTGLVNDVADLFSLTIEQLSVLTTADDRAIGEKTATKLISQIGNATQAPLARVITSLGIRMMGRTMGRRLAAHFHTMEALLAADEQTLCNVEGVGAERAAALYDGLRSRQETIDKLRTAGVTMGEEPSSEGNASPLAGLTVVVTGKMTGSLSSLSRNEMNELIESQGGKSSGSVSAKTSLLVCSEPGSSKYTKALGLGTRIVTPEEFAEMINGEAGGEESS